MKKNKVKKILIFALAVIVAQAAFGQSDANQMKYVEILSPTASLSTTGTAVSVAAYKGNATLAVQMGPYIAAATCTVTIAHASATTGTWYTVTNTAGTAATFSQVGPATTAVQTVSIDMARLKPYVRAVVLQSGQDTNSVSALLIAPMKSE